ncbi:ATP-binding protein [Streptomyces sp. DSM 41524]|uniref:ATP-binding protein n=2 Tax=Streptomyces violaceusniger group TaxID=2839105 RepID=A0A6G4AKQ4_9ACTN|nr:MULTISPECIES: ATP-binding protein [Streptomyces]MEE4591690.1 ATP-binding protein [Streptomyces sp. DSM 41524]NEW73828.1 ATP-binding protein [Streptomyces rhizosphaericus]TMU94141.1 ATP-binding protein [Streptomyces sp. DASNCL29]
MKQGTLKTLGVIALGAAAVVAGGSAASAAPVPGGSAGRVAAPGQPTAGQPAAKPAAPQAKPAQGMLSQLPLGSLGLVKLG